jgi:hypothetical protein
VVGRRYRLDQLHITSRLGLAPAAEAAAGALFRADVGVTGLPRRYPRRLAAEGEMSRG